MTKADQKRFAALHRLGCICCLMLLDTHSDPDIHHLLSGGKRKGNEYTIPLCPWHHRSVAVGNMTNRAMTRAFGPSLADGSRTFDERWGTQHQLLERVNGMLSSGNRLKTP